MALPNLSHADLEKLKMFINFVSENPAVLNLPQLVFVKEFIEKFGGKVPAGEFKMPSGGTGGKCPFGGDAQQSASASASASAEASSSMNVDESDEESESEPESEIELDMEGVIEADTDAEQPMGDSAKTPTEEEVDQSSELRSQAAAAYSEQKFDEAINLYTKAIEINPGNALFHAKRGQAFLKLKKPNACIRDCNKALELNCDSAAAYKFRGRAHRLLGNWEEAAKDLRQACKLDFDEEADEWLREVTPNAKKIEQHRIKQERKKAERDGKKAQRRARAHAKERQQQQQQQQQQAPPKSFNPDFMSALNDKEFQEILADIAKNPANIEKHKNNPKFAKIQAFAKSLGMDNYFNMFAGAGAGAGATEGDADVGAGAGAGAGVPPASKPDVGAEPKKPDFVDDGLD